MTSMATQRVQALQRRSISMVADDDSDVPEALRFIADELTESGEELLSIDLSWDLEGTHDPGEDLEAPAPEPSRVNIQITAELQSVIDR